MPSQTIKLGAWIQGGINLYRENFAVLFLASLLASLLGLFTLGILAGPLFVGFALIVLRLIDKREPKPQLGDIFKGFEFFLPSFLFVLGMVVAGVIGSFLLDLVPVIGGLLGVVYGLVLGTAIMFGVFLIGERGMDAWTAAQTSFETVRPNFLPFLGLHVLACLLGGIGMVLCGVGIVLTAPVIACILGVTYRDVFGAGETSVPENEAAPPTDAPAEQPPESTAEVTGS